MWNTCVALLCCAAFAGADDKPKKEPTPKEKREAAIKAIKAEMEPIEKKLAEEQQVLAKLRSAAVTPGAGTASARVGNRLVPTLFKDATTKQKAIDNEGVAIEKLEDQLAQLQKKLKDLQKPPKPEPKAEPTPEKPGQ